MKFDNAIYDTFRKFCIDSLNDTLRMTNEYIYENSLYRYGDLEDKINVIEDLKRDHGTHFNFLNVKGVVYTQGQFELDENEFKELLVHYKVNLENYDFGLYENENDQGKPFGLKSFIQVTSILDHCLRLQILKEAKQQLTKPEILEDKFKPNLAVFKNRDSHLFFDYLFNDWLRNIKSCRPQLSYIVYEMTKTRNAKGLVNDNVINDFAITCPSMGDFVEFWNSYPHTFKLTFKKSRISLSDEVSNIYEAPFYNRKKEFIDNIM